MAALRNARTVAAKDALDAINAEASAAGQPAFGKTVAVENELLTPGQSRLGDHDIGIERVDPEGTRVSAGEVEHRALGIDGSAAAGVRR